MFATRESGAGSGRLRDVSIGKGVSCIVGYLGVLDWGTISWRIQSSCAWGVIGLGRHVGRHGALGPLEFLLC